MSSSCNSENPETLMTMEELISSVNGTVIGNSFDKSFFCFKYVVTDSRLVTEKSLFVPLVGEFQDGHKYIPEAVGKGASVIFVENGAFDSNKEFYENLAARNEKICFVKVENNLHALQNAAFSYVEKFPDLIKIAVTGSSGKTTTKEIAVSILREKYSVICNKGNLNSETGLPLSVFEIRNFHEVGLFEMGMNRKDEILEISSVLKANFAIITNIGNAHIGLLKSRENIAAEKKNAFRFIKKDGAAIIPADDDFAEFLAEGVEGKIVFFGKNLENAGIKNVKDLGIDGTEFELYGIPVRLPIPGKYNFMDCVAAVELAEILGLNAQEIKRGIEKVSPLGGRSRILKGKYTILEDCYNANPDSMEKSLEFASSVNFDGKKIFVLGDMLEIGEKSSEFHEKIGAEAASSDAALIIFAGKESLSGFKKAEIITEERKLRGENSVPALFYSEAFDSPALEKIAAEIHNTAAENAFVFIKASHGLLLERLIPLLQKEKSE